VSGADDRGGPLSGAALALEAELARIEGTIREAARGPLTSRRALEQAAARLGELSGVEQRVAPLVEGVALAIAGMVDRQRAAARTVAERAAAIAERRAALAALLAEHEELGRAAAALNASARQATSRFSRDEGRAEVLDLAAVTEALARLAQGAGALVARAREAGFVDVEGEARAMEQQLLAARNALRSAADRSGRDAVT
jgi:hypothetical protein